MQLDPSIFKAYDIRGKYPDQINEDVAYQLGLAFTQLRKVELQKDTLSILVSRDMRLSSDSLHQALVRGLLDAGSSVVDIGLASTPTMYFATAWRECDGGIQVSASHNPKDDNGFKIVRDRSVPVSEDTGMFELRDMIANGRVSKSNQVGTLVELEHVLDDLYDSLIRESNLDLSQIKPLKIVVDAANAMGAIDIQSMFSRLPCELIKLNFDLDGNFPAHQPDPLIEANLEPTSQAIIANQADLGIVPDGDGDRYFFLDNNGEVIRQEILRGLMAQIELHNHPGATVAYDIRPGRITLDMIKEAGGKPLVTRVGHSLIKEAMIKDDAIFGGESSGHYFYKFSYGTFESPFALVLKFLLFISSKSQPLSDIVKPYKKYFHSGEINSEVTDKEEKIKEIASKYADAKLSYLDGITVEYDDFWFNVRPSNTENKLRLNLEAIDAGTMVQKRDELLNLIRE